MKRRGLTLVEVLLSVALLAALSAAVAALTADTSRTALNARPKLEFEAGLAAILASIADDLGSGDFDPRPERGLPRVRVDDGNRLVVRTRGIRGPVERTYLLDERSQTIVVTDREPGAGKASTRPVLWPVEGWECAIDEERGELSIEISGAARCAHRRYPLR